MALDLVLELTQVICRFWVQLSGSFGSGSRTENFPDGSGLGSGLILLMDPILVLMIIFCFNIGPLKNSLSFRE